MVNYPEFDLNDPYTLPELTEVKEDGSIVAVDPATLTAEQKQEKLNAMWRNGCINDTYEPDPPSRSSRPLRDWRREW